MELALQGRVWRAAPLLFDMEFAMLKWALIFAVIALIAGALGFTGVAAGAAAIAKVLFFVFLVICLVFLLLGLTIFKSIER
jgi:uncharacterized membrane protein YtjA (UPF0391 family)